MQTIYVFKNALTQGIKTVQAEPSRTTDSMTCKIGRYTYYLYKNKYALTPEEAIEKAEALKLKKIASLEKQLAKLKALKFTVEGIK